MARRWQDERPAREPQAPKHDRPFGIFGAIVVALATAIAHRPDRRTR
jgi:hypothetical protein